MPEWRSEMSLSIQRLCFYLQERGDKEPELSKLLCEDGVLLLTDSADFYRRARCVDIACVCYQKASGYIEGVEYVIEDAAQLDMEWLNRCYQRQKGIPWVIAKTERCIIREMTTADIDRLYIMYEKEGIGRYVRGLPGTYADIADYMRAYIMNMYRFYGFGMWLVQRREDGAVMGEAGLVNSGWLQEGELELGYALLEPYRRRGYGLECVRAVIEYAGKNNLCSRIVACIPKENKESAALACAAGLDYRGMAESEEGVFLRYGIDLA